jgi:hypothetical protein
MVRVALCDITAIEAAWLDGIDRGAGGRDLCRPLITIGRRPG